MWLGLLRRLGSSACFQPGDKGGWLFAAAVAWRSQGDRRLRALGWQEEGGHRSTRGPEAYRWLVYATVCMKSSVELWQGMMRVTVELPWSKNDLWPHRALRGLT